MVEKVLFIKGNILFKFSFFFIVCILNSNLFGQNFENISGTPLPKPDKNSTNINEMYDWSSSLFLAAGWGFPQGIRTELGYNFGKNFMAGISFGIKDQWSKEPSEGFYGAMISLRIPTSSPFYTPYILLGAGGKFVIFGGADNYKIINFGLMVSTKSAITIRPEFTLAFTSKYISGGSGLFGSSSPEVWENKTRFGINLLVELDLKHIF
jgi:hypothetical protein